MAKKLIVKSLIFGVALLGVQLISSSAVAAEPKFITQKMLKKSGVALKLGDKKDTTIIVRRLANRKKSRCVLPTKAFKQHLAKMDNGFFTDIRSGAKLEISLGTQECTGDDGVPTLCCMGSGSTCTVTIETKD